MPCGKAQRGHRFARERLDQHARTNVVTDSLSRGHCPALPTETRNSQ
ncbi:MAG: hypothetical protein RLZZ116_596 [Planctomycetota bacterium]|jgi:hypothetical protein